MKKPFAKFDYETALYEAAIEGSKEAERRLVSLQERREAFLSDLRTELDPEIRDAFQAFTASEPNRGLWDFLPDYDIWMLCFRAGYEAGQNVDRE